jgi:hypothetical protein
MSEAKVEDFLSTIGMLVKPINLHRYAVLALGLLKCEDQSGIRINTERIEPNNTRSFWWVIKQVSEREYYKRLECY